MFVKINTYIPVLCDLNLKIAGYPNIIDDIQKDVLTTQKEPHIKRNTPNRATYFKSPFVFSYPNRFISNKTWDLKYRKSLEQLNDNAHRIASNENHHKYKPH